MMIGGLCLLTAGFLALTRIPDQPARASRARITGMVLEARRTQGLRTIVTFRPTMARPAAPGFEAIR